MVKSLGVIDVFALLKNRGREFSGGPVVRTWCFQAQRGNQDPISHLVQSKNILTPFFFFEN